MSVRETSTYINLIYMEVSTAIFHYTLSNFALKIKAQKMKLVVMVSLEHFKIDRYPPEQSMLFLGVHESPVEQDR